MTALIDFPRELSLGQRNGKWVLTIHAPDLHGEVISSRRETVETFAEEYARWRREAVPA